MPLLRPALPLINNVMSDWWQNHAGVSFIAHAVTATSVVPLGPEAQSGNGGTPPNHPDQVFWKRLSANRPAAAAVLRIEVDCTLMPCDGKKGNGCCLYVVPQKIVAAGYPNKPVRFFSHRDEQMGATPLQNKRMFHCNSSDKHDALDAAYNTHENWFWSSMADPRVNNGAYHLF